MKKILLAITVVLSSVVIQAQEAKVLFGRIPESVLPLFSSVNRADFIDFLESNMKAKVKNKFDGTSEMTDLTGSYIRIQLNTSSTWEMKTLPVNDSTQIICVVSTVCAPVCDSNIDFYTANWQKIAPSEFIELPVMDDYFHLTDSVRLDEYTLYRQKMDMLLATATLYKEEDRLTFALTTPGYIGTLDGDEVKEITDTDGFLRKPLEYVWTSDPATGVYKFRKEENLN